MAESIGGGRAGLSIGAVYAPKFKICGQSTEGIFYGYGISGLSAALEQCRDIGSRGNVVELFGNLGGDGDLQELQ